jgi:hypothetical protein
LSSRKENANFAAIPFQGYGPDRKNPTHQIRKIKTIPNGQN